MNQANKIALVHQVIEREFPDSKIIHHAHEWTLSIGDGVSVVITTEVLESKTVHEILLSVVSCAETKGIKPRSAIP